VPEVPGPRSRAPTYHILVAALGALAAGAVRADPPPGFTEAVLEVSVNARGGGQTLVVLKDAAGRLYLEAGDFARLNLVTPTQGERVSDGHRYFPLAALPRVALEFDAPSQHLDIKAPRASAPASRPPSRARSSTTSSPTRRSPARGTRASSWSSASSTRMAC